MLTRTAHRLNRLRQPGATWQAPVDLEPKAAFRRSPWRCRQYSAVEREDHEATLAKIERQDRVTGNRRPGELAELAWSFADPPELPLEGTAPIDEAKLRRVSIGHENRPISEELDAADAQEFVAGIVRASQ